MTVSADMSQKLVVPAVWQFGVICGPIWRPKLATVSQIVARKPLLTQCGDVCTRRPLLNAKEPEHLQDHLQLRFCLASVCRSDFC